MIWFTEIGNSSGPQDIIFQFFPDELPEIISFGKATILKKLKYFGGFHTNQIIGTYPKEVEISGRFFGYKNISGRGYSAQERYLKLESLMGRPLRVGFPQSGMEKVVAPGSGPTNEGLRDVDFDGGFKGVYIIEECVPKSSDYLDVEYTIRLVPHQRQEKIQPTETTQVQVQPSLSNIEQARGRIASRQAPRSRGGQRSGSSSPSGAPQTPSRPVPPKPEGTRTIGERAREGIRNSINGGG